MLRRVLRWAFMHETACLSLTKWHAWLEPTRDAGKHPGGLFLDVADREGLTQLRTNNQAVEQQRQTNWTLPTASWTSGMAPMTAFGH